MTDVRRRMDCRLCASTSMSAAFALASTPLANAFRPPDVPASSQQRFPLELFLCDVCGHLQLGHVVDPSDLFSDYVYVSGTSPVFVRHFDSYADDVVARLTGTVSPTVVEIGSNDGTLLAAFKARGAIVQGIDPAQNIAATANAAGIPTINGFFDAAVARQVRDDLGAADAVVANNVCAHIDDLSGVVASVAELLADDGLFVFEVSYRKDVIEKTLFDTIYHEHLDYHAVRPLAAFLARHGLRMIDVQPVAAHGGSIRVYAAPAASTRPTEPTVDAAIRAEEDARLFDLATYTAFYGTIADAGADLRKVLADAATVDRKIAGYGAPAKATTLMFQFELDDRVLQYVVDDSPWKQGLMCPGTNTPVVASETLTTDPVDDLLILAWNFAEPITARAQPLMQAGARAIIPLPTLKVQTLS